MSLVLTDRPFARYARPPAARPGRTKLAEPPLRQNAVALIIDNDPDFRYILTEMLAALGYHVVATDNIADARRAAVRAVPTLIITDLRTGLHDAGIIPGELRRIPSLEGIPMIVCSAWPYPDDRAVAQSLGADLFMTVPVDFHAIRELAARVIS